MNDLTFTVRCLLANDQTPPKELLLRLCDQLDASIPDPLLDWSDAPDDAMWAARDADGDMFYFVEKPVLIDARYWTNSAEGRRSRYWRTTPRLVKRPGT